AAVDPIELHSTHHFASNPAAGAQLYYTSIEPPSLVDDGGAVPGQPAGADQALHARGPTPVFADHHEDPAQGVGRAADLLDPMPGLLPAHEQHAVVPHRGRRQDAVEVLESRRRIGLEAALVVEDQRLAAPFDAPVLGGVEIEDVGPKLAPGIAVRRYRAAVRRVVPVQHESQRAAPEHALDKSAIGRGADLTDERPPRL